MSKIALWRRTLLAIFIRQSVVNPMNQHIYSYLFLYYSNCCCFCILQCEVQIVCNQKRCVSSSTTFNERPDKRERAQKRSQANWRGSVICNNYQRRYMVYIWYTYVHTYIQCIHDLYDIISSFESLKIAVIDLESIAFTFVIKKL